MSTPDDEPTPDAKPSEADAKPSEADAKPSEADAKPSGAAAKPSETDAKEPPRSAVLPERALPGAGTPEGEALRRGLALYQVGDYAQMRAVLTPLAGAKDPAIADAASDLLRRIAVDPVQIGFLIGCLLAIVAIALRYLG